MSTNLLDLGWNDFFEEYFRPYQNRGLIPARVACGHKDLYSVLTADGETAARVSGKYRFRSRSGADYPGVGDWIAVSAPVGNDAAIVHGLLPRRTWLSRKVAWTKTEEQMIAANIDIALLISGMDGEFNIARI